MQGSIDTHIIAHSQIYSNVNRPHELHSETKIHGVRNNSKQIERDKAHARTHQE